MIYQVYHATLSSSIRQFLPIHLLLTGLFIGLFSCQMSYGQQRIQVLIPQHRNHPKVEKEFSRLVADYNRSQMGATQDQIELIHKGDESSALRDLITLKLAGKAPALALIENAEIPILPSLELLPKVAPSIRENWEKTLKINFERPLVPYKTVRLIWLRNQTLFEGLPKALQEKIQKEYLMPPLSLFTNSKHPLRALLKDTKPICLSNQGSALLWSLEALAPEPLWKRELGGVRQNQNNAAWLAQLIENQSFAQLSPASGFVDLANQHCLWTLVPSSWLPLLEERLQNQWKEVPALSTLVWMPPAQRSEWLVLNTEPRVLRFLQYLLQAEQKTSLQTLGGFEIPGPVQPALMRPDDTQIIRIRGFWTSSLEKLLMHKGSPVTSTQIEDEWLHLDRQINNL